MQHLMKKVPYKMTFNNIEYNYDYIKNSHAFRGQEIDPKEIKIIILEVVLQMKDINLKNLVL